MVGEEGEGRQKSCPAPSQDFRLPGKNEDNEMPYGRVPQGHPVIVDYFYHEEIRGTENTGKRNR